MALRLRTLPAAIKEIEAMDSETPFKLSTLRTLVKKGEIPVVHIRNRQLVNMDFLIPYLSGEMELNKQEEPSEKEPVEKESDGYGVIRKVRK